MHLILWILRLLFGLHLDGSSRSLPVAVRPDGRTECHHGADWLWHWLQGCADWLKIRFWRPRPRGWDQRPGGSLVRGTAPPGTD